MRVLGLDVGERRIGVAMSDPSGTLASSHTVIERKDLTTDLKRILAIIGEFEVQQVVVGLPRSLDGSIGPQAQKVLEFMETLQRRTRMPVVTQDEWLSTVGAGRALAAAGVRGKQRRERIDAEAAAFILQGYLDRERARRTWDFSDS
ncbi:MAG: Holliday junction resolvase RuvX [Chloroflexi bacterium]|nr:Holliday junction resolvase RuvX [Chloroflexota bacterium]